MGGITTGVGIFSGIDSASLIDQLISIQSRPQILAQQRVVQLQTQQAAYLDINSRLSAFKTAAASFRVNNIFSTRSVASNNEAVLTATASISAVPGSYNFIVDRLVSSQQLLTRGFSDQNSTAVGLDSLTFESEDARLDRNTALADLNNGNGIVRGEITVNGTAVDLSRAGTVREVLDKLSQVPGVTARVENDKFVIEGVTTITQPSGSGILESLGLDSNNISGTTLTGTSVYSLNSNTPLATLNDGLGVLIRQTSGIGVEDFTIVINGETVKVRIGEIEGQLTDDNGDPSVDDEGNPINGVIEGAVSTIGGVINRINSAMSAAGYGEVVASINQTSGGIDIVDSLSRDFDVVNYSVGGSVVTTASDLGIEGSYTGGTANGTRILAGLNTKLVANLNGGTGLDGTDGLLTFDTKDGANLVVDISGLTDINDIINAINADGSVTASINSKGTGIKVVDNTTGVSTFAISGTGGQDTAAALGIAGSYTDGIAKGDNLQLAYIGVATKLSDLNNGQGIGLGKFEIVDSYGNRAEISITNSDKTVRDLIRKIDSAHGVPNDLKITARINDNGDGIAIFENPVDDLGDPIPNGASAIKITNVTGTVATKLGIEGTATGVDGDNYLDGSYEKTIDFDADATLDDIRNAIDAANIGVSASIINTGIGSAPFRLNLTSERTGEAGRFLVDSGTFDLGLTVLNRGDDARVFFGSDNAADGVLLTSSVNQLDGIIQGVTIDLHSRSTDPVEINVSTNTSEIETKIKDFVAAFNKVVEGIDFRTRYDDETKERGVLLGDSTMQNLKNRMYSTLRSENDGFTDVFNSLTEVGIRVGSGGKVEFDSTKFRDAYAEDPDAVERLFTERELAANPDTDPNTIDEPSFSSLSVLGQLEEFADSYVSSIGGVLQTRKDAIDSQIKLQEERIESIKKGLENKRIILQRQFLAMEQAIGSFQTQGNSLAQLGALG